MASACTAFGTALAWSAIWMANLVHDVACGNSVRTGHLENATQSTARAAAITGAPLAPPPALPLPSSTTSTPHAYPFSPFAPTHSLPLPPLSLSLWPRPSRPAPSHSLAVGAHGTSATVRGADSPVRVFLLREHK
eukprot:scaffold121877_cov34-Tisochrysis_lutea.AAC.6